MQFFLEPRPSPLINENTDEAVNFVLVNKLSFEFDIESIVMKMLMTRVKELTIVTQCQRLRYDFSKNILKHVFSCIY